MLKTTIRKEAFFAEPREAQASPESGNRRTADGQENTGNPGEPAHKESIGGSIEEIARMAKEIARERKARFLEMLSDWNL